MVNLILTSRFPMFAVWGPDLTFLYNDSYRPILGNKPEALGRPFAEVWADIWDDLTPLVERALAGEATFHEDRLLVMERHGYREETYFTFSYSPIRDESGRVAGMFCACTETTATVIAERQQAFRLDLERQLRDLAHPREVIAAAAERLGRHLNVAQVGYAEIDGGGEFITIGHDWGDGRIPSVVGHHRLADFGDALIAPLRRGESFAVSDVSTDDRTVAAAFDALGIRAVLAVPLVKEGQLVATLFVHHPEPRMWSVAELTLTAEVAQRTGSAVERARAEMALRESEARFRDMADNAPVMIWVTEPDGQCSYLNRPWYEFTGQAPGLGQGLGWIDAIHPEDRAAAERSFLDANARQHSYRTEFRLRRADGSWRWALDAAAPRFHADGQFLGYVGSVIDITDIREAEQAVRAGEERLRLIANLTPAFIWFAHPDGSLHHFNDRWYAYTGQTPAEALPDGWIAMLHPDDVERTAAQWDDARARGHLYEIEVRYRRRDGEYRWFLARAEPLRDGAGRITGWFGSSTDIHERKMAEEALQRLNATLEVRVAEETAERERAQVALLQAQKTEALGQMTGGVAHDFNNLLQALSGCLAMIERRAADAPIQPLLDAGRQAVDRGAKLVQQLMAFARRQALRPEAVDLRDRVLGMSDLLTRALRADIRLETNFASGLWPVEVDPTQLELALLNLSVNARDAMPTGGALTMRAANVSLAADHPSGLMGDFVRLTVSDTGTGMPPDIQARAFDPFFTTKEVGKGSGLGLSQVYGFAQHSGGTAWIESVEGGGTWVHLLLPRSLGVPVSESKQRSSSLAEPIRSGRVLVVEDDPIVAMTVATALEDAGFTVIRAATGDEALPLLAEGGVDLLFSDVVMPGSISGVELAREAQRRYPNLPIVLATGYSEEIARATGVKVLPKPYRIDLLIHELNAMLTDAGQTRRTE
ncbi:PAS domain S-box protein [Azospirillum soli]|uniref:PAS domain S-box protein n=1 Tax=Azospirillum soli TaxID=1304799 RepID=UPI0031B85DEB